MLACRSSCVSMIELLQSKGANTTDSDEEGSDVFMFACQNADVAVPRHVFALGGFRVSRKCLFPQQSVVVRNWLFSSHMPALRKVGQALRPFPLPPPPLTTHSVKNVVAQVSWESVLAEVLKHNDYRFVLHLLDVPKTKLKPGTFLVDDGSTRSFSILSKACAAPDVSKQGLQCLLFAGAPIESQHVWFVI